ncbi:hypothetical protein CEXT_699861 [Caerostris extrusa]|uniref:Uncharacterized protein n=1 Tax=Caerostris extrusa TaxID=172846 RepID=A0AAV4W1G2_CAEEX|nr:hypothetical protein CEXT_699861 [Caerostris extrusa]
MNILQLTPYFACVYHVNSKPKQVENISISSNLSVSRSPTNWTIESYARKPLFDLRNHFPFSNPTPSCSPDGLPDLFENSLRSSFPRNTSF